MTCVDIISHPALLSFVRSLLPSCGLTSQQGGSSDDGAVPAGPISVLHEAWALLTGGFSNGGLPEGFTSQGPVTCGYPSNDQLVRTVLQTSYCS